MEIEAIKIDVSASVKGENKIDRLAQKLEALGNALKGIPQDVVDKLERLGSAANFQMGKGPTQLASAIKKICDQSDKLGGVVDEMGRLASYDFSNLSDASEGIKAAAHSASRRSANSAESMTPMTSGTTYREAQEASAAYNDEADAADNASGAVREHADESVRAARKIEKHTSALGKAVKAFGRILAYRAIRNVIKTIGQAFAEGRNNLYQYSLALNNLDSAKASGSLNDLATAALYAKNSVGAMMGPIIQSTVPLIQQLVDWLAIGTNAINQFISALQGKTTYTRAKKYADDYADSVKGIGKAAKEALSYLLPFDELNVLPDNSDRGGGSTPDLPDYSEMFEEVEINEKLLNFVNEKLIPSIEWIKQHMDEILTVAGAIGTAILGWNFSKAFLKNLPGVGSFAKDIAKQLGLDKALEIGFGVVLTLTGFTMSWSGAHNIAVNGWAKSSLMDKINAVLGPVVAGIGGALIGGAIGGLPGAMVGMSIGFGVALALEGIALSEVGAYNVGLVGWSGATLLDKITTVLGPVLAAVGGAIAGSVFGLPGAAIGATIGLAIGLTITGIKLAEGEKQGVRDRFYDTDLGKEFESIKQDIEQHSIAIDNMSLRVKNVKAMFDSGAWKGDFEEAKKIVEEIFAIDASDNKTFVEIKKIKDGINTLNGMGFTDLNLRFDDLTGHIVGSKDEVIDTIEQIRIMAQTEALYDMLVERTRDYATASIDVKNATEKLNAALDSKTQIEKRMKEIEDELVEIYADTDSWTRDTADHVHELGIEYTDLDKILNNEVAEALKTAQGNLDTANETLKIAEGNLNDVQDALRNIKTPADQATHDIENAANKWVEYCRNAVRDINTELANIVTEIKTKVKLDIEAKNAGKMVSVATPYASGGYVSDGELYIAREAGPEMVGRIGSRNAVANNDQIVAGIASGVEEANEPVVNAVLAIGAQIVGAIRESGGNGITVDDIARGVTRWQARQARAVGV